MQGFPTHELKFTIRERQGFTSREEQGFTTREEQGFTTRDEGLKLGVGDFVFYSVYVYVNIYFVCSCRNNRIM